MIIKVLFEYVVGTYILLIRLAAMMHSIEMEIIGVPVEWHNYIAWFLELRIFSIQVYTYMIFGENIIMYNFRI